MEHDLSVTLHPYLSRYTIFSSAFPGGNCTWPEMIFLAPSAFWFSKLFLRRALFTGTELSSTFREHRMNYCGLRRVLFIQPCTAWNRADGSARNGRSRRRTEKRSTTS